MRCVLTHLPLDLTRRTSGERWDLEDITAVTSYHSARASVDLKLDFSIQSLSIKREVFGGIRKLLGR